MSVDRRIPESLGTTDTLLDNAPLVGTVEVTDGFVAFGPAMSAFIISNQVFPADYQWMGFVVGFIVALVGLVFLLGKPNYISLSEWLRNYIEYRKRPRTTHKALQTDGGYSTGSKPITNSPDTRNTTLIEQIYPEANAIERTDGAVVGMVELGGINLDTALKSRWEQASGTLANFFNTQIQYEIQFYLPMRKFDPSGQIQLYENRADSAVDEDNALLLEYLDDRRSWFYGLSYDSYIRECYVIVAVDKSDVLNEQMGVDSDSVFNFITETKCGELLSDAFVGLRGTHTISRLTGYEMKERQLQELNRRLNEINSSMGSGESMATEIISADKAGILLKEYWEGVDIPKLEGENLIREKPIVTK